MGPRIGAILLMSAWMCSAQMVGAGLQGEVTDPAGAVVAGAAIEVLHVDTGTASRLATDDTGHWREPALLPGEYQVKVSAPGFQTIIRKGIHLTIGQGAVLD